MFQLTRRLQAVLPLGWLLAGYCGQPHLLTVPSLLMLFWLVLRHLRIVGLVGSVPWASVGFARHTTVDDLARLASGTALSPLVYILGSQIRHLFATL